MLIIIFVPSIIKVEILAINLNLCNHPKLSVLGFMTRCTQYLKPTPVPKDRIAFPLVLSQKNLTWSIDNLWGWMWTIHWNFNNYPFIAHSSWPYLKWSSAAIYNFMTCIVQTRTIANRKVFIQPSWYRIQGARNSRVDKPRLERGNTILGRNSIVIFKERRTF